MTQAASIFALRVARRTYGSRADVRTCHAQSWSRDGNVAEFQAFVGRTKGNETTGHNITLTVRKMNAETDRRS